MIREKGRVIEYKTGLVKIQIDAKTSCHSCKLCSREKEGMTMEVLVDSAFSTGDMVNIEIEGRNLLFCFFMLYLFPVISFIAGIIFGMIIADILSYAKFKEPLEIISGFIFFAVSLLYIIWFDKKYKEKGIIKVKPAPKQD
ncbi:MAG: SoxR reducing system RseC family protein [bacterium]|nr:SoxR reducing system RseC family protein [bacterium]